MTQPEGDILSSSVKLPFTKWVLASQILMTYHQDVVAILMPPLAKEIVFTGPLTTLIRPTW